MSDLSLRMQQAASQLPVSAYFSPELFQQEQAQLFQSAPRYVGHAQSVPQLGDYHALAHESNGRALVRTAQGVQLLSNVCRHRQAVMLQGRGNTGQTIVCPLHRWTYATDGRLQGAPHFAQDPCLHLQNHPLREWNGLLFEDNGRDVAAELSTMQAGKNLNFGGYVLGHVEQHHCAYNWKTFIEVYLEDYHVGPFHPGLGQFVSCDDLDWEFNPHYSVQTVGVSKHFDRPGSAVYQRWHAALQQYNQAKGLGAAQGKPERGAIWLTYYPHIMVEWYPHVLTVSALYPKGPQETLNVVEFYYPEEIAAFEPEFVAAQRAAYMETCAEDDEIALRMDAGRFALHQRGDNEVGPYQSPMEDGMKHFHQWYRQHMPAQALDPLP
jgi:choline monooxygenase